MHDADAEEGTVVPPSLPLNFRSVTTAGQTKRLSYFEVSYQHFTTCFTLLSIGPTGKEWL